MASIGGVSVTTFSGRMPQPQQRMRQVNPWLEDGQAVVIGGVEAKAGTVTGAIVGANEAAANSAAASLRALIETQVTVVDQWGASWANVLIMAVRTRKSATAIGTYVLDYEVDVLPSTVPGGSP
jgi:hypothetical protein